jgi:hypothetical protein
LASGQIATEILDVDLPPGAMQIEDVQRQAALLDDEPRPHTQMLEKQAALGSRPGVDLRLDPPVS